MSSSKHNNSSFQIARLFRKTSASGNTYFTGRLGGARVSLLKSRDTADDGGEIWSLMIAEAPRQHSDDRTRMGAVRDYQAPANQRAATGDQERARVDDEIPF